MTDERQQPREVTARVMGEVFDEEWLREYAEKLKGLTKGALVDHTCAGCGKRAKVKVEVPDFKGINDSILELWNQGFGRPGMAEGEPGGVELVIERLWPGEVNGANQDREHVHAASDPVGVSQE